MSLEERALHFYQEFFSRTFILFDSFYESKHPDNLLQFPLLLKEFEAMMVDDIRSGII